MTLGERAALIGVAERDVVRSEIRWLTDLMAVNDATRTRLQRWGRAGLPAGPFGLSAIGDMQLAIVAEKVLNRLPPPAAWHIEQNALVVTIAHVGGLWTSMPKMPDGPELKHVITLNMQPSDDETVCGVIAHEFAHAWTAEIVAPNAAKASAERYAFDAAIARAFSKATPEVRRTALHTAELNERRAARLAAEWGFSGPATDADQAARGAAAAVESYLTEEHVA